MAELVERHNPTQRQLKFREEYLSGISPLYNGVLHIAVIYAVGIAVISFCASRLESATWEWLLVVPVFFFSNLFDWWTSGRCARSTTGTRASTTSTSPTAR